MMLRDGLARGQERHEQIRPHGTRTCPKSAICGDCRMFQIAKKWVKEIRSAWISLTHFLFAQ
jgi:hypothetical protein